MLKFSFDLVVLICFSKLLFESIISYPLNTFPLDCHVLDFIKIHLLGWALFFFQDRTKSHFGRLGLFGLLLLVWLYVSCLLVLSLCKLSLQLLGSIGLQQVLFVEQPVKDFAVVLALQDVLLGCVDVIQHIGVAVRNGGGDSDSVPSVFGGEGVRKG